MDMVNPNKVTRFRTFFKVNKVLLNNLIKVLNDGLTFKVKI